MKKHIFLRVFLVLCLVVLISNFFSTQVYERASARSLSSDNSAPTSTSSESRDDILNRCAETFMAAYPDHSRAQYDPDTGLFLLCFWQDDIEDVVTHAISGEEPYFTSWNDICTSVEESSLSFQRVFDEAGYRSVSVDVRMLNPNNKKLSLLHVSQGVLLYDVVTSAAGDSWYTPETLFSTLGASDASEARGVSYAPAFVSASPDAGTHYVLNTNSKKFHLPYCGSVSEISSKNRSDFYGTREDVIAKGYRPCGQCNP